MTISRSSSRGAWLLFALTSLSTLEACAAATSGGNDSETGAVMPASTGAAGADCDAASTGTGGASAGTSSGFASVGGMQNGQFPGSGATGGTAAAGTTSSAGTGGVAGAHGTPAHAGSGGTSAHGGMMTGTGSAGAPAATMQGGGGAGASPFGGAGGAQNAGGAPDDQGAGGSANDDGGSGGSAPSGGGSPSGTGGGSAVPTAGLFVGYYETWSDEWKATGAETVLAHLPAYVNVVNLSFMQPDCTYVAGSMDLTGSGVSTPYDGPTLRDAIAALHANQPNTKVIISVGGATYANWSAFDAQGVASFVSDFGLDGVDLDYEPYTPGCTSDGTTVTCPSDSEYTGVVTAMRAAMPRPSLLSIAAWSVGAYGEGQWANGMPTGSAYMGIALAVLKDANASAALDLVNVMSYDASSAYDPTIALSAYQHYFQGNITMGIEVPPEAWGGHVETTAEIDALADAVTSSGASGLMLWSLQKQGPAQAFATEICTKLSLSDCTATLK